MLNADISLPHLRRRLLAWFDRHRRDLPWRRDRDPYHIWVSEVMLQQTTVAAVVPYFERFLVTFPTLAALAAADEQAVLKAWEGLGYYRRARHLHRAARALTEHGKIPDDAAVWRELPGVGRYILGAVLSQAFDRRLPIVEANSARVLCRLYAQEGDASSPVVRRWLWERAEELLPRRRVGDFNQALMELGALVCTPTNPDCDACPLRRNCVARKHGLQSVIPRKTAAPKTTEVREVAIVVRRGLRVLLVLRPADAGRWQNMWEFPRGELGPGETYDAAARRLLPMLTGLDFELGSEVATIRHGVTRFRITLVALEGEYRGGRFRSPFYTRGVWVRPRELEDYPVSTPQRRLARVVAASSRQRRLF